MIIKFENNDQMCSLNFLSVIQANFYKKQFMNVKRVFLLLINYGYIYWKVISCLLIFVMFWPAQLAGILFQAYNRHGSPIKCASHMLTVYFVLCSAASGWNGRPFSVSLYHLYYLMVCAHSAPDHQRIKQANEPREVVIFLFLPQFFIWPHSFFWQ